MASVRHDAGSQVLRGQSPESTDPVTGQDPEIAPAPVTEPAPAVPAPRVYLPITLREAIEAALSDSSVVRVLNGRVNLASVSVWDAMIAESEVGVEEGRFQPRLSALYDASQIDQPPNAFFGPGIALNNRRDYTDASARIIKPLKTGGSVSLGLEPPTAYLYFPDGVDPGEFNPVYSADYVLRVSQPLLRGGGTDVVTAPIQIAQLRANQSRWEVEEQLNAQIRSVTETYWQLYAAYVELEAIRAVLPLAEESVRIEQLRLKAERTIYADLARAQFQLEGFRRSESITSGEVRRRILQLRQLMGGEASVDPLLLPAEKPGEQQPPADSQTLLHVAVQQRPILNQLRDRVQEQAVNLRVAENRVYPELDLRGQYRASGIQDQLDDSFRQANTFDYTDWTLGVQLEIPLGNQSALSRRRIAELELMRDRYRLASSEQNVAFEVMELISDLQTQWERYQLAQQQASQTQEWLRLARLRYSQPPASSTGRDWLLLELADFQTAMRSYIDAVSAAGAAIADYNTLLAELDQAQGISMYRWRQQDAATELTGAAADFTSATAVPDTVGGHSLTAWGSYRADPQPLLENIRRNVVPATPEHEAMPLSDGATAADGAIEIPQVLPEPYWPAGFGHSFSTPE